MQVDNFSYGILNPGVGYLVSCLGAFLGLRSITRARAYTGRNRATWLLIAIAVVAVGLFIVGYGGGGVLPVLAGGVIFGIGVATMHYVGMAAMSMPDTVRYDNGLVALSVLIAVVAGTAALLTGLRVSSAWSSLGMSLIMGVAVTGMHYTGMAAMRVYTGGNGMTGNGMTMSGHPGESFIFPLLLGGVLAFLLALVIAMSPSADEIRADAILSQRLRSGT